MKALRFPAVLAALLFVCPPTGLAAPGGTSAPTTPGAPTAPGLPGAGAPVATPPTTPTSPATPSGTAPTTPGPTPPGATAPVVPPTAGVPGVATPPPEGAQVLTFEGAIELALGKNPDVAIAAEAAAVARAQASNAAAKRLPNLSANFDYHYYKDAYSIPFGSDVFFLYHHNTTTTTVAITQPLTGLAYLSEIVGAARHGAEAAKHDYDRARLDVAYRTAEGYVRVLQARGVYDVSQKSIVDIQGEVDRAQKLRAADTYTDIDVLRFQSALAAAQQAAIRARANADEALAQFIIQLGLPDGSPIDIADDLPTPPPALAISVEDAQKRAFESRPELKAAAERIAAADQSKTAAREQYLPDVRLQGVYLHTTGVQPFQPADAEFLGVTASWNVFDWGGIHANVVAAEHQQAQARLGQASLGDSVRLDVRRRWLDARAGYDALELAQTQVKTAEEAYRLQKVRFDAGASTATDVLDAETDVSRARLAFAGARYDYYVALVALARAMGDLPNPANPASPAAPGSAPSGPTAGR